MEICFTSNPAASQTYYSVIVKGNYEDDVGKKLHDFLVIFAGCDDLVQMANIAIVAIDLG